MNITKKQLKNIIREQSTAHGQQWTDPTDISGWKASTSLRKKLAFVTDATLKNNPKFLRAFKTQQITAGKNTFNVLDTTNLWSRSDEAVEQLVVDTLNKGGYDAYWKKNVPITDSTPPQRTTALAKLQYKPDAVYFDEDDKLYVVEVKKTNSKDFSSVPTASNVGYDWYILIAKNAGYIIPGSRYAAISASRPEVRSMPKSARVQEFEVEKLRQLQGAELENELDSIAGRVVGSSTETLRSFIKKILKNRIIGDKSAKLSLPISIAGHKIRADIKFEHVVKAETKEKL
jgi:hypothetical protein